MKKILSFVLLLLLAAGTFAPVIGTAADAAHASDFLLNDGEKQYLDTIKNNPITLAVTSGIAYYTNSEGAADGLLIPFIRLLEDELGLDINVVNTGFKHGFDLLNADEIDLFGLSILSAQRRKQYYATDSLLDTYTYIYTKEESAITGVIELEGKRIGLLTYSVLPNFISVYTDNDSTLHSFDTVEEMLTALENSEIDCFVSALTMEQELVTHPQVVLAICAENMKVSQGVYANQEKFAPLIDIVNRYLETAQGRVMRDAIQENRVRCILDLYRDYYRDDIERLKSDFEVVKILDSGTLYPLSYIEDGSYKGLQSEINKVFSDLTGVPVALTGADPEVDIFDALLDGRIDAAVGIYRSDILSADPRIAMSRRVMTDRLSFYTMRARHIPPLTDATIGSLRIGNSFVDWEALYGKAPVEYRYRADLVSALKGKQVDVILLGEMSTDYYYTILGDYMLERVGDTSIPTSVNMLFNADDEPLNTLFDLSIRLYEMINPTDRHLWTNSSQNAKFEQMQVKSELYEYQRRAVKLSYVVVAILVLMLAFVYYQYAKFRRYDNQVSMLLRAQGNADMMWGNLKTGKMVSKGGHPIAKRYNVDQEHIDIVAGIDVFRHDIEEIEKQGRGSIQHDDSLAVRDGEPPIYVRRFTYKINDREFMSYFADITAEVFREKELSRLANTDCLTRLFNRRAMSQSIVSHISERKSRSKIYFFMLDIDNFKRINDSHGHDIGDKVLVKLAHILVQKFGNENVARWGGEEFLGYAELDGDTQAVALAESVLREFAGIVFPTGAGSDLSVTVSCGVSAMHRKEVYTDAIKRADNALYIAKREGKNCVRFVDRDSADVVFSYYGKTERHASEDSFHGADYGNIMGQALRACFYGADADEILAKLLKIAVECADLDFAYILEASDDGGLMCTHHYDPGGSLGDIAGQKPLPHACEAYFNTLKSGVSKCVSDISKDGVDTVAACVPSGTKAYAHFPILSHGKLIGAACFADCRSTRVWNVEERRIFSDLTVLLCEAVLRKSLVKQLEFSNAMQLSILDYIDEYIYVVDLETRKLLFANKKLRDQYGDAIDHSSTCYSVLRPDLDGICPFCIHGDLLDGDGKPTGEIVKQEVYNELDKKRYDVTAALMNWENSRLSVVMVCRDQGSTET